MRKTSWPRDLADLILLDIQFLKGCEVEWKSTSQPQPPAVSAVGPLSDVGPAAAADDDAPRRSPPPDAGVAARFEDAAFDFTKWDIYNDGTLPMDRFRFSRDTSLAFPRHFAAAGLVMLNRDCNTCQAFKDLKFVWERRTGMEFEGSLQQLHAIMMIPSQAKWSSDEERWLRDNCKAFAALKAPAPAPSTASAARAAASPATASANASPAPTTRAQAKKTEAANKPPAAAAADAAGTESDDVEQRDAGRASSARGVGTGRGRGRVKQKAVRLQPHQVRRPAPRLVATGQLEVPLEDPADRPAKKLKHVSKEGKVVSIVTGPSSCVVFPG